MLSAPWNLILNNSKHKLTNTCSSYDVRTYKARRALRALKGVVKLQALVRGHNVRKQAKMTLRCMQALVRVQARVLDQRMRLSHEATPKSTINNTLPLRSPYLQSSSHRKSLVTICFSRLTFLICLHNH